MKIAGLVKTSLIDYPGKVAAVVFTQGCNFRCGFCHNPDLIPLEGPVTAVEYPEEQILEFLDTRSGKLDGVVITGGEPMLQPDLLAFMRKIKGKGLLVKLDTNGSNPAMLKTAISEGLVDYIAMDIKGPLENYEKICGYKNTTGIERSIKLIMDSGIDYDFRTTVLPHYHKLDDFHKVGELLRGAKRYTLQGFRPKITYDKSLAVERSFNQEELAAIASVMESYVKKVVVHDNLS